ncbi:MAG: hypothetical protein RL508_647 [Actinomycetota bacterium]
MTSFWLPVDCLICGQPPLQVCQSCRLKLPILPRSVSRPGLVAGWATTAYEGAPQMLVHALKERGSGSVAKLMATAMAQTLSQNLEHTLAGQGGKQPVLLVPAPSRRSAMARRGFVPAVLLAKAVARQLRATSVTAQVLPLLRVGAEVADQSGLNRLERQQNLAGKMNCKSKPSAGFSGYRLVLIDDVVTTGATLREMQRCLTAAGWQPVNFLTFAETL